MNVGTSFYRRGSQVVSRFAPDEDRLIEELRILGLGTTEIAKFVTAAHGVRRSSATINMRLKTLAAQQERSEP